MAEVTVKEAEAVAIEKRGLAEALAIKEKLGAEASGLAEKAEAMKALDGVGKEHEEYRLRLEKDKEVELEGIRVRQKVAEAQAHVLGKAFESAKLNIVGGDGAFFDRFVKAVSLGQSIDGALDHGETLKKVVREYMEGERSLPDDVKQVLSRPAVGADELQKLTVSGVLAKLMLGADEADKGKLRMLADKARELGLDRRSGE